MSRLATICTFLSMTALLPVLSGAVVAQCGVVANFPGYPLENGTSLDLINDSPSVFTPQDLQDARSKWTSCPGAGSQFPAINAGEGGGRDVHIVHKPGANPQSGGGCERVDTQIAGHTLLGATITIYDRQNNNTSCFPLAADIGHALGHILGLADATSGSCGGTLMGARQPGQNRTPAGNAECNAADWGYEMADPEPGDGGEGPPGPPEGPPCV